MSFDLASRLASRRAEDLYRQRPLLESAQGPDVVGAGQAAGVPTTTSAWPIIPK